MLKQLPIIKGDISNEIYLSDTSSFNGLRLWVDKPNTIQRKRNIRKEVKKQNTS